MVVQAEGAGWAIDGQPERARAAVGAIAETGRSTLIELRRLLGVLRDGDQDGVAPQPGLAELAGLVEGFRSSGLSVALELGLLDPVELRLLPESLQLAVFRIVQEGLTNVLKHAGPAAKAGVRVSLGQDELSVEVQDDGIGAAAEAGLVGHGLIGIRERVGLFGGQCEIGAGSGGGFTVSVRLPRPEAFSRVGPDDGLSLERTLGGGERK